jgi:hypothetical protein
MAALDAERFVAARDFAAGKTEDPVEADPATW